MGSKYLSAGVYTKETDLSQIISSVETTAAAIVGASNRGPVLERTLVTNTKELLDIFGQPDARVSYMHYSALAYLEKGNKLYVTRVANSAEYSNIIITKVGAVIGTYFKENVTALDDELLFYDDYDYSLGTGDGSSVTFSGVLESLPVSAINSITVNDIEIADLVVDLTEGTIEGTGLASGTINASNGAISLTFTAAPTEGHAISVNYNGMIPGALFMLSANNQGTWGNSYGITITNPNATDETFVISLYYRDSSGVVSEVEKYTCSRKHQKDGYGKQLFVEDRINNSSVLLKAVDNSAIAETSYPGTAVSTITYMQYGDNGLAISDSNVVAGWNLYTNVDDVDLGILINGGYTSKTVQDKIKAVVEGREDSLAVLDVPYIDQATASAAVTWREGDGNYNSSYLASYLPNVKIYDPYNDLEIEVPPSGFIAAQIAYTDYVKDPWFPPAGLTRGLLPVRGLSYDYTQGDRDILYAAQLNPLRTFAGAGIAIWGQKTMQEKASATDRINVRRLVNTLKKAISTSLKYAVFELNTEFTRLQQYQMVDSYLAQVKAREGVYDYQVVCDETNNNATVIDNNELHLDVYIKPTRAAEFVQLQVVITTTGASFNELTVSGGNF